MDAPPSPPTAPAESVAASDAPAADGVPSHTVLDRTAGLRMRGHVFALRLRERLGRGERLADRAVEVRLLGRPTLVAGGRDAVRFFYDPELFRRRDAIPPPVARTLFGRGAVHVQDGEVHRHRKAMFLGLLDHAASREIGRLSARRWDAAVERWEGQDRVVLFDEAVRVLGVTICAWADLPLTPENAPRRIGDLREIVDGFGSVGLEHVRAQRARMRCERWVAEAVRDVREGRLVPREGSALAVVAAHRELDGSLLDDRTAAVELLNVVRPTVAVAWFVAFAALALRDHPQERERLARPDGAAVDGRSLDADLEAFVHELRRVYPFAPVLGARARRDLTWRGARVREGQLVLLDLYGTNHDPDAWPDPGTFDPRRFDGGEPDPYAFVPQGGGDPAAGHRCAGERVTVELLKAAVRTLATTRYTRPEQDLGYSLSRIPTRPRSGVVLSGVRRHRGRA